MAKGAVQVDLNRPPLCGNQKKKKKNAHPLTLSSSLSLSHCCPIESFGSWLGLAYAEAMHTFKTPLLLAIFRLYDDDDLVSIQPTPQSRFSALA
jgi:hypothetical protein